MSEQPNQAEPEASLEERALERVLGRVERASALLDVDADGCTSIDLDDWLALWRQLPPAQRAAAAQEARDHAVAAAGTLLQSAARAVSIGPELSNRAGRLDAGSCALSYLAALLGAIAADADADDTEPHR